MERNASAKDFRISDDGRPLWPARTAFAAKQSLNDGLKVAFRAGAVMGLVVVGFALLDISAWFFLYTQGIVPLPEGDALVGMTTIMLSYGMGASTQALFARVGGGIYTKAADVGADLVGKVEAGIPEDDARNPATIADNVGDNVGDVAGMGADLYESYYGSILATMAIGAAAALAGAGSLGEGVGLKLAIAPLALAGFGVLASLIGVFVVKAEENASFNKLLKSLHMGVWAASAIIVVASWFLLQNVFAGTEISSGGVWGGHRDRPSWRTRDRLVYGVLHQLRAQAYAKHCRASPNWSGHRDHRWYLGWHDLHLDSHRGRRGWHHARLLPCWWR